MRGPTADYPTGRCIHHLIEEQAARTPDADAVIFESERLSYAELNARANQLAHHLQRHGIGPDVPVALCVEPSLEMIVGILGILKAGGAYVPLDPEYPQERASFMLQDTRAPVVLTQERLRERCAKNSVPVLCLDNDWSQVSGQTRENPLASVTSENLAYVIYTSGSTGTPKGVLVSHENLVHSTWARVLYYRRPVGRYLLLSSFAFDSSVAGIFWTLIQGGALVLPPAGTQRDPKTITELIARHRVTHTLCLASHYALILAEADRQKLASVNTAIVSGEVFSISLVNRHDELMPQANLYNEYGPTEASVWCIVFDCREPFTGNKVPIGRPIANTMAYILDSRLRLVPVGVQGELHIGGIGVTKGYLNRPELTAERFLPDPFSNQPGARMYKTGDLARCLPDGNIEFLGRMDEQVKLRGYRIELGEIEAVLGQHPAVREAVVVDREDVPGDKRLVAYFVVHTRSPRPAVRALREHLATRLPEYMVPAAFVSMNAIPRTTIGKLDRAELPPPPAGRPDLEPDFVAPRTSLEQVLAGICEELLYLRQVGIHDNFFDLGIHSILIVQFASRVRDALQVDVPLRTFFETPTVAGLTAFLCKHPQRATIEKTADLVVRVARLSDADVDAMLGQRSSVAPAAGK